MGVKLNTNAPSPRTLLQVRPQEKTTPAACTPKPAQEPVAKPPAEYYQDAFEAEATPPKALPVLGSPVANEAVGAQEQKNWKSIDATIAQTNDIGCGEASLTFLNRAKDRFDGAKSEVEERDEVRAAASELNNRNTVKDRVDINLDDGTTADEAGAVLGSMGIEVKRGMANYDSGYMSDALKSGQFGLAMVDSTALYNSILPADQRQPEPGKLHWVTIDGFNKGDDAINTMDDKFRVQDPVNGQYWVGAQDLLHAMDSARLQHDNSGGMLILENRADADTTEKRDALARKNLEQTASLGKGTGIGSKRMGLGESS